LGSESKKPAAAGVISMNRAKAATLAIATLGLALASVPAKADIVIDVVPWLAPNFFGSPSFPGAEANAVQGMGAGYRHALYFVDGRGGAGGTLRQ
jgi:hypothetical protein